MADDTRHVVAQNRKARHEYLIEETIEAGLVLVGTEVKSVRAGQITLTGGFATVDNHEAWLREVYIAPYEHGNRANPDPRRVRKLLLNRREIERLTNRTHESGWTIVPLSVYFVRGVAKVELGLARGKRAYDKREALRTQEAARDREREMAAWRRSG